MSAHPATADAVRAAYREAARPLECKLCGTREFEVLIGGFCGNCLNADYADATARLHGLPLGMPA